MPGWGKRSTEVTGTTVSPYRPPRPVVEDLIVPPADFGTRFLIFADVEEEFDWRAPLDTANRATDAMASFPDAHRRFADHGTGIVCMVDHPVAVDPRAVDILRRVAEDGRSAIGAQLHTWVTPPFAARTPGDTYAGNLPRELEAAKLGTLTDTLTAAFGPPRIFRSGRYGIGPATIDLLAARGYLIDSSVRAQYDYRSQGGPDFSGIGSTPYRWGPLIELPLTTAFTGLARNGGAPLYRALGRLPKGRGVFARTGLLERIALTPEDMPIDAAIRAVDAALADGQRLVNFSFHSPSLAPGHTPYVRDAADLAAFWRWWDRMFAHLARRSVTPATLDEVIAALR